MAHCRRALAGRATAGRRRGIMHVISGNNQRPRPVDRLRPVTDRCIYGVGWSGRRRSVCEARRPSWHLSAGESVPHAAAKKSICTGFATRDHNVIGCTMATASAEHSAWRRNERVCVTRTDVRMWNRLYSVLRFINAERRTPIRKE